MLTLSLVVPVYNEVESIGLFLDRVQKVFDNEHSIQLEIVFVNDGSSDGTLECLLAHQRQYTKHPIRVVDLSRNFGKEAAITAGLRVVTGRAIVPIDVDLQDPPEVILAMIAKWRAGYDVVLGRRINRVSDSWAKRTSATWFYRVHNHLAKPAIPENVGDFRLMDRIVVDALNELQESRRFMKGLFAWVGFRTTWVAYERCARAAGMSKFNGWRLWNFALEGMTSFSTAPLRIWTYIGGLVASISFAFAVFVAIRVFVLGIDVPGYASVIVAVTFLGGLQLIGIGVIGEYLGRAYLESKRRPVYFLRHVYEPGEEWTSKR